MDAIAGLGERHAIGCWLFLRALGLVHVVAFLSMAVQVDGLIGSRGILPARDLLDAWRPRGWRRFVQLPTACWIGCSDRALKALCWVGVLAGLLVAIDVATLPALLAAWVAYLSLMHVSGAFLGYQWDVLLVETTVLAMLVAPLEWRPGGPVTAASTSVLVLWWLVFRLVFSSGVVKLRSGDPTWRSLTAMTYHYETQPLPNPLSWAAHAVPRFVHVSIAALTFVVELAAPFLIFGTPAMRHGAALAIVALMLGIMTTGNYGFFNPLTIAPCLVLVDDATWTRLLGAALPARSTASTLPEVVALPVGGLLILLALAPLVASFRVRLPERVEALLAWLQPFRLVNGYGLFAVMTTTRPEIVVEGSEDGVTWREYEFRWKPGDPARRPRFCPHMPRLDWQAWFAALGTFRRNPWFLAFLVRLLEGSPPVLKLLGRNPFPGGPPRLVRAVLWRYSFTDPQERRATGAWWRRERVGLYAPPLALRPVDDGAAGHAIPPIT